MRAERQTDRQTDTLITISQRYGCVIVRNSIASTCCSKWTTNRSSSGVWSWWMVYRQRWRAVVRLEVCGSSSYSTNSSVLASFKQTSNSLLQLTNDDSFPPKRHNKFYQLCYLIFNTPQNTHTYVTSRIQRRLISSHLNSSDIWLHFIAFWLVASTLVQFRRNEVRPDETRWDASSICDVKRP